MREDKSVCERGKWLMYCQKVARLINTLFRSGFRVFGAFQMTIRGFQMERCYLGMLRSSQNQRSMQ